MAVKIRMKKMGRRHRPFFRVCATDTRKARDGRVIEELGFYDPMVKETDARAVLNAERIDYWLGVGAQPSDNVKTLIKKYGTNGTHLDQQAAALERLKIRPEAPPPVTIELPKKEEPVAEAAPVSDGEAAPDASAEVTSTEVASTEGAPDASTEEATG